MINGVFEEEPLQIVAVKEDGILEVTIEGINFLNKLINQKLSILSLNGLPQSGKSFLGNSLIGKMNGFKIEKTNGIWIWGKPINLDNGVKLLILDSQGLNKNEKYSTSFKLYILNILISNCIIYNFKENITEEMINDFIYFSDLSKQINVTKDENNNENSIDNLSNYYPSLIWTISDYSNNEINPNEFLEDILFKNHKNENIKKLFRKRNMFFIPFPTINESKSKNIEIDDKLILTPEYNKVINNLMTEIKKNISIKKINNLEIDGDSLFGILQNYIDSLNNDENPIISQAIDNILLSRATNISEKCLEDFKIKITKKFENKFPMNFNDIYTTFFEFQDKTMAKFIDEVKNILNTKTCGEYIRRLNEKMISELENIFETNNEYYDEWFEIKYNELKTNLNEFQFNKFEEVKNFIISYLDSFQNSLNKFLDIPNSDFGKNLITMLLNIFQEFIVTKFKHMGEQIGEMYLNITKDSSSNIEDLNLIIKRLNEQLEASKKILEDKRKEKSELERSFLELQNKYDKYLRETKSKEKENDDKNYINKQKYQQMENHFLNQIKERENTINEQKVILEKLNKDILDSSKENSNKINELNKDNNKLNVEIERLNGEKKAIEDINSINQTEFKKIQQTFMDFKESVDKLDKESENMLKKTSLELSAKEIKNKANSWIEEIRLFRETQIKTMTELYEESIKKYNNKINELNLELTKKIQSLYEEEQMKKNFETKYNESNKEIEELNTLLKSKESLINTQNEAIKIYENKINELKKNIEHYELSLNKYIVNFKMKEDELETMISVIDAIITKKIEKFEYNASRLSSEIYNQIIELMNNSNFKF